CLGRSASSVGPSLRPIRERNSIRMLRTACLVLRCQFSPTSPSWRFRVSSQNLNSAHQLRRAAPPSTQAASSGPLPSQWQRRVRASPASLWSYRTSDSKVRALRQQKAYQSSQLVDARAKRGTLGSYFNGSKAEFSANHRNDYTVRKRGELKRVIYLLPSSRRNYKHSCIAPTVSSQLLS